LAPADEACYDFRAAMRSLRRLTPGLIMAGCLLAPAPATATLTDVPLRAYVQTSWAHRDGVPLGSVADIAQTPDGYLWLGASEEGLLRFDGTRFVPLPMPCVRPVTDVEGAPDGSLWMMCDGRVLRRLPSGTLVAMPHPALRERPRTQPNLFADRRGRIWFPGTTVTYFNADGTAGPTIPGTEPQPHTTVTRFAEDGEGVVWYADGDRLFRIRDDRAELIVRQPFFALAATSRGGILASQDARIMHVTDRGVTLLATLTGGVTGGNGSLMAEREGNIWLGTRSHGIALVRGSDAGTSSGPDDAGAGTVMKVFIDRENTVWMGTSLGLHRFRRPLVGLLTPRDGVRGMPMFVMHHSRGDLFFGSPRMFRLGAPGLEPVAIPGVFRAAAEDRQGVVWLATAEDIGVLNHDRFSAVVTRDGLRVAGVFAIRRDESGTLWALSTQSGLYRIDNGRPQLVHAVTGLGSEFVVSRQLGHWVARDSDGVLRSPSGVSPPERVAGAPRRVHAMVHDGDSIWMGSEGGLSRWRNGVWTNWTSAHGLPRDGLVTEVMPDGDRFWLVGRGGILVLPRKQLEMTPDEAPQTLTFIRIGELDRVSPHLGGLQPSPRVTRGRDGTLYFATRDAIAVIDPSQVTESSLRPAILIDSVEADHQPLALAGSPRLVAPERIQFDYTSLSLRSPENIRFRYRLEGHDADWIEAGRQRRVTYNALPPGHYRFRVIGSSGEGVWNLDGASFSFSVAPVFWRTWWFTAAAVVAFGLVLFTGYRYRLHQMARDMDLRFEARLAERNRIAQDLHDSLLQGTIAATLHLQMASDRLGDHDPAKVPVQRGLQLLERVMAEGRATVQGLRAQSGTADLIQRISQRAGELADLSAVDLRISVDGSARPLTAAVREEATHIICEALINAIRHAGSERIDISVGYSSTAFACAVRDHGKGMTASVAAEGIPGHWGLAGMRERARNIGGNLSIVSHPGGGTSVELSIPSPLAFEVEEGAPRRWWERVVGARR
jgi:signal transduction histidine kinase/ligand-binding sensor domain-containing protein